MSKRAEQKRQRKRARKRGSKANGSRAKGSREPRSTVYGLHNGVRPRTRARWIPCEDGPASSADTSSNLRDSLEARMELRPVFDAVVRVIVETVVRDSSRRDGRHYSEDEYEAVQLEATTKGMITASKMLGVFEQSAMEAILEIAWKRANKAFREAHAAHGAHVVTARVAPVTLHPC